MAKGCQGSEPEQAEYRSGQAGPDPISNRARVDAALPTIKYALEYGAKTFMLCAHLGRPNGKKNEDFLRAPVAKAVEEKIGRPVQIIKEAVSSEVKAIGAVDRWLALP